MKKPTNKIVLSSNQEMGIIELLKAMPDSTSFVFQVGLEAGNYDYYMKLGDPVFTPDDTKYVSVIPSMGFNRSRRKLWFGEFFIPRGKELKTITNKQLLEMLDEVWVLVKHDFPTIPTDTISAFKLLGYE